MKDPNIPNEVVSNNVELTDEAQKYHPSFTFCDADIILRSTDSDSVFFRVHSHALRMTCGFFRDMFTRPRGAGERDQGTIQMEETGIVLERFLEIIYCMESPAWKSRTEVQDILLAAEKYQARGVMSRIRPLLLTPLFTDSPLELYSLAAHLDLEDEAKYASRISLSLDIYADSQEGVLSTIPSNYLMRLVTLHEKRKRLFRQSMDGDASPFHNLELTSEYVSHGHRGCAEKNDLAVASWQILKARILEEVNEKPLGDTITGEGMTKWEAAKDCWQMTCTECSTSLFEMDKLAAYLKMTLTGLPSTI